jgi:hypothetical protein
MSEFAQHIIYYLPSWFITEQRERYKKEKCLLFLAKTSIFVFLYDETFQRMNRAGN